MHAIRIHAQAGIAPEIAHAALQNQAAAERQGTELGLIGLGTRK
jgi:hypothetical protein